MVRLRETHIKESVTPTTDCQPTMSICWDLGLQKKNERRDEWDEDLIGDITTIKDANGVLREGREAYIRIFIKQVT